MANEGAPAPQEIKLSRWWYEAHLRRVEPDYAEASEWVAKYHAGADEAFAIRDRLAAHGDLERFKAELQTWSVRPDTEGFNGPAGMMLVNSLVNRTDDPAELARLLTDGLTAPRDRASAAQKLDALIGHIDRIKVGAHPAPGHAPFLLSYFWGLDRSTRWPVVWPSGARFLEFVTGQPLPKPSGERYLQYVDQAGQLDDDPDRFQAVAAWWDSKRPVFLNPVLVECCSVGMQVAIDSSHDYELTRENEYVLRSISNYICRELTSVISDVVGLPLRRGKVRSPGYIGWLQGADVRVSRPNIYAAWSVKGQPFRIQIEINHLGAFIGIRPAWWKRFGRGWYDKVDETFLATKIKGFRLLSLGKAPEGGETGLVGSFGKSVYGRWYEPDQLADLDLRAEVRDVLSDAQPAIKALVKVANGNGESPPNGPPPPPKYPNLDAAAEDLLVDRSFLDDIVGLLEDKGQVILYGPPGTGKTFLARRLAEALALDSAYRKLVQFHPSTSYEDFFEGYRPEQTAEGGIGYRLTLGPLARMAEHALEHPGRRHVMVIDEINRANLPRVLGELLFLFEYRDEQASTLYRPDDEFRLPDSIWFIGTMNTADRSIALVDAALRRRFHFVPFFPGRGPTAGLLERWLDREGQPVWVGELVAMVNDELTEALGGDLQLGASHFMRKGYRGDPGADDVVLRRIWEYNIEPFIEDQLFGDAHQIGRFRFGEVVARYRRSAGEDDSQGEIAEGSDQPGDGTAAPAP